ncbi:hypothetical protein DOTSEDRAFT_20068 [Dothistroma septosporum NZE10]|uniref:PIPK domain-containing protein n=1 Tax=Dothistroma septosporum (strain NZE10 / CBS 128990) TaxID=675120 RepID=N1Q352_DOTSN|nr:hypothetical protein DOTSEDRAFT_20068 [Dothistroma septosporum NZE10]
MPRRQDVIARSVTYTMLHSHDRPESIMKRLRDLFLELRELWHVSEEDYRKSFGTNDKRASALDAMGNFYVVSRPSMSADSPRRYGLLRLDLFRTADSAYLGKSIPRPFEYTFFKNDLLLPYTEYVQVNPGSHLVRITDFLECARWSIGTILGPAPSHHIVMENILYGKDHDTTKWENFEMKPRSYSYPERDVAGGVLTSEATKSKLTDDFDDKISLSLNDAEDLRLQLEKDTA